MKFNNIFLSSIFKYSDIGFVIVDSELKIVEANDYMLKNFDVFPKNYIGISFCEISNGIIIKQICDDNVSCKECNLNNGISRVLNENIHIKNIMVSYGQADDNQRFYKINAFPQNVNEEKYVVISFVDITKSKNLENIFKENQNNYKILFENMTQGFALHEIITDVNGKPCDYRFINANPAFEKLTGYKAENIIGKTVKEIMPEIEDFWIERYGKVALSGEPCNFENYSAVLKKYYEVNAFCPQKRQFAIAFFDITDRKNIENALFASENRFKNYIDNAPDGVFIADLKGNYLVVNEAVCHITGYTKEELLNKNIFSLTPLNYHNEAVEGLNSLFVSGTLSIELPFIRKDKENRIWSIEAVKRSYKEYIGFQKDITEKNHMQEKLQYYFYHDQLTGLYNRRYINQNMERYDNTDMLPLSVVVGDINGLKIVNDAFGNNYGDKLIKNMADVVRDACGEKDIIGKWGGDEFIIIMPQSDIQRAEETINKIKKNCENKKIDDIELSISFGWASKTQEEDNFENILKISEDMMLKNKIYESASFRSQTINMILKTLHEKNKREEQHSIRVSKICIVIGKAMNLNENDINKLRVIGLVHDIGKIGINENILNKVGKLTTAEYNEIKKHPEIGYRILSSNTETSELALHILSHHERYDGKGYPNGLKNKNLSLMTKILTVADSYDAMTSERPYKNAMTKSEAIEELIKHSAKQFDPDIIDLYINKVLKTAEDFEQYNVS